MTDTIKVEKDQEIGVADILIFGAHLFQDLAEENEVEVSAETTLKNGKKYKATLIVNCLDE